MPIDAHFVMTLSKITISKEPILKQYTQDVNVFISTIRSYGNEYVVNLLFLLCKLLEVVLILNNNATIAAQR